MPKPSWSKSLSFSLDFERGMPARIVATWQESIEFLDQLIRKRDLELYHVYVHWHPDPDLSHYCGVTYIDEKRMAFCAGNDKETMLHEIAHLENRLQAHDESWAEQLIDLHGEYLSGSALEKANTDLARDYRAASRVLKRRSKQEPQEKPRKKTKVKKS